MSGGRAVKPQLPAVRSRRKSVRPGATKPGVPAQSPPGRSYGSFDVWVELGNRLTDYYVSLTETIERIDAEDAATPAIGAKSTLWRDMPEERLKRRVALDAAAEVLLARTPRDELADAVAAFDAGHRYYERDELYEAPDRQIVSRKFVASRVAMLLGAFPAGSPSDPDIYTRRLVEELIAGAPSASQTKSRRDLGFARRSSCPRLARCWLPFASHGRPPGPTRSSWTRRACL